jgi:cyclic pyranopterin phosphate synthase
MIADRFGRSFTQLRVSLTAACNYACEYCVADGEKRHQAKQPLNASHLLKAVSLLDELLDLKKIRLTGGEPLIAPEFDAFIEGLDVSSFEDVSLTTNGEKLAEKAEFIYQHGIRRVNVSIDSIDPVGFKKLTRGGNLENVLEGIQACVELGMSVKLNAVPMRTNNHDQILPLLDYALANKLELRFIELMRMGHLNRSIEFQSNLVKMDELLSEIRKRYDFVRLSSPEDSTAIRFQIPDKGTFGVIANESEPFCAGCNRLRLSSSGYLFGCLSNSAKHGIQPLLELPREEALQSLESLLNLALADKMEAFSGGNTIMRVIGG